MDKKKILIIVGIISAIGIGTGLYFWNKRKKSVEAKESTDDKAKTDVATDVTDKKTPVKGVSTTSASATTSPSTSVTPPATTLKKLNNDEINVYFKDLCGKSPNKTKCAEELMTNLRNNGLVD